MTELPAADPALAIAAYLKSFTVIDLAVEGRVFRPELPEGEIVHMPRAAIVIREAGGGTLFRAGEYTDSRLDIVCYGSTRLEASNISREVARALKHLTTSRWEGVKLYWARAGSRPASAIDPNTNWPFALVTTQVMHSLSAIA